MPKRILISDPISSKGVALLENIEGLEVIVSTGNTPEKLSELITDIDALIVRSQTQVTPELLQSAKQLKVIGRAGVGVDNIDIPAASAKGVVVMNTPTGNTISAAELAFSLLLSTARNITQAHQSVLAGKFKEGRKAYAGVELYGKRIAVIGMGRIGTEFAKRAIGFGMEVTAYDPFLTQARADALQIKLASTLKEALQEAHFLSLHLPLSKDTKHLIDAQALSYMAKGAIVINCARGGLLDEKALKDAINSGQIAGCGLDVYEEEPPTASHPLFSCNKHLSLTPHLGASTQEAQENVGVQIAEQIADFLVKHEVHNAINMPSIDAAALRDMAPYLGLSTSLGRFLAHLGPCNPDSIRISYHGSIAKKDTRLLSRHALLGYLEKASHNGGVNIVNAEEVAAKMGLEIIESTVHAQTEYSELLIAELRKGEERFRVAGTIIGKTPRIVEIDKLFVDTPISGHFVIVHNDDSPGIVGRVGTVLGESGLNIAGLSLARNKTRGHAINVLQLDAPVSGEIIKTLESSSGILSAKTFSIV